MLEPLSFFLSLVPDAGGDGLSLPAAYADTMGAATSAVEIMANAKTLIENLFMHLSPDCIFGR